MTKAIPAWALKTATPQDRERTEQAYRRDTLQITWPESKALRAWAKQQGWPAPRKIWGRWGNVLPAGASWPGHRSERCDRD